MEERKRLHHISSGAVLQRLRVDGHGDRVSLPPSIVVVIIVVVVAEKLLNESVEIVNEDSKILFFCFEIFV